MASLTDVISDQVSDVLRNKLTIEIDAEKNQYLFEGTKIEITARLKLDGVTISTDTTKIELKL